MKYITVVRKLEKTHTCLFCHEKPENMLEIGKYFFVIPARAPYTKHHLLIIPKRHANTLITLSHEELKEMHKLVDKRARKLHTKYKDVSLLLRDGLVKDITINKSVNHIHFHLIPNVGVHIEGLNKKGNIIHQSPSARTWIEDKAYTKMAQSYRKTFW